MTVLIRINQELKLRKSIPRFMITSDIIKTLPQKKVSLIINPQEDTFKNNSYNSKFDFFNYEKNEIKIKKLLSKKTSTDSGIEVDIPSFLNDKNSEKVKKIKENVSESIYQTSLVLNLNGNFSGNYFFIFFF